MSREVVGHVAAGGAIFLALDLCAGVDTVGLRVAVVVFVFFFSGVGGRWSSFDITAHDFNSITFSLLFFRLGCEASPAEDHGLELLDEQTLDHFWTARQARRSRIARNTHRQSRRCL